MRGRPKSIDYRNAVFKCLADAESSLWVNQISRLTGVPAKTVTNILDEFHDKGLIDDRDIARETKGKVKMRFVTLKSLSREELTSRLKAEKTISKIRSWHA